MPVKTNLSAKRFIIVATILIYVGLCFISAYTNLPQVDEGFFADPAYNLAQNGIFGTTAIDAETNSLTRIEERTYWVMPLFLLNAAAFFKVFGFSLLTMRLVSTVWGIVALISFYYFLKKLTNNEKTAIFGLILLAFDYIFLFGASFGRMDAMCLALGLGGLAVYLNLREKNLPLAIFLSQSLVVLSGLTHPNGLLAFLGLLFLTFYFDRQKLNSSCFIIGALPFIIGGLLYLLYIWQDPQAFGDQFFVNATMSGRMSGFSNPFNGIWREFTEKYALAFGLKQISTAHSSPLNLKVFILLGYISGFLGCLVTTSIRKRPETIVLLTLTIIYFLTLSILDGQKLTVYLIHSVPFYLAFLAIYLEWLWQKRFFPQLLIALFMVGFAGFQVSGLLWRSRQDAYHRLYQPAIDFLQTNAGTTKTIMGNSSLGFGLKFPENLNDDARYGLISGKRADFLVFSIESEKDFEVTNELNTKDYEHFVRLTQIEYQLVFQNQAYKVFQRKN